MTVQSIVKGPSKLPKYSRYQDYVIKDGKLVGEFEEMYRDFPDPWEQTSKERHKTEKKIALHLLNQIKAKRVVELGCGLGHYTNEIAEAKFHVLGVDISPTAIEKARNAFPSCTFQVGDILDFEIYDRFEPDAIIMAEITWYVLEKLDRFLDYLRKHPSIYLIHMLTTYPKGVQKYGGSRFTNLEEMMHYFSMHYLEFGEIGYSDFHGERRTYFVGRYSDVCPVS